MVLPRTHQCGSGQRVENNIYIYIYIERERQRETETERVRDRERQRDTERYAVIRRTINMSRVPCPEKFCVNLICIPSG